MPGVTRRGYREVFKLMPLHEGAIPSVAVATIVCTMLKLTPPHEGRYGVTGHSADSGR